MIKVKKAIEITDDLINASVPNKFYKKAILMTYQFNCLLCNSKIERWDNFQIDHLVPKSILNDPNASKFFSEFGLKEINYSNFINSLLNLIPMHSGCNRKKTNILLSKESYRIFLDLITSKVENIIAKQEEIERNSNNLELLSELMGLIDSDEITISELLYALALDRKKIKDLINNSIYGKRREAFNDELQNNLTKIVTEKINEIEIEIISFILENKDVEDSVLNKIMEFVDFESMQDNEDDPILSTYFSMENKYSESDLLTLESSIRTMCFQNGNDFAPGALSLLFEKGYTDLAKNSTNVLEKSKYLKKAIDLMKIQFNYEIAEKAPKIVAEATFILLTHLAIRIDLVEQDQTILTNLYYEIQESHKKFLNSYNWNYGEVISSEIKYFIHLFIANLKGIKNTKELQEIEKSIFHPEGSFKELIPILIIGFESTMDMEKDFFSDFKSIKDALFSFYDKKIHEFWEGEIHEFNEMKEGFIKLQKLKEND